MAQIEDFGQKIGGARKDVWKLSGITDADVSEMNDMERDTYVKKDNIWIKPNWEQLVADGTPQPVAYWQNKMRQAIPPKPSNAKEETQRNYVKVVSQLRDMIMSVKDQYEIKAFYEHQLRPNFMVGNGYWHAVKDDAQGIINSKVLNTAQISYYKLERESKQKLFGIPKEDHAYVAAKQSLEVFCYDRDKVSLEKDTYDQSAVKMTVKTSSGRSYFYLREGSPYYDMDKWQENTWFVMGANRKPLKINFASKEEAEAFVESFARGAQITAEIEKAASDKGEKETNRKKNFVPPQLSHVRYDGPDYRVGKDATGQMFLDDLKFRAGEFGNWLNNADRQTSLNMGYDALRNLADILQISPHDASLNGTLAIAFGARGRGGANAGAAHYEPLRQVINLTKMSGAGCLAHEFGHGLDHAIGLAFGIQGFASEAKRADARKVPDSFAKLMLKLRYKETKVSPEELKKEFDPKIEHAQYNLKNWISSAKPSKLPEDLSKTWDEITKRILENPQTFNGSEYWSYSGRTPVHTHPDVEQLSQICKFFTNHVMPKDTKQQICVWSQEVNRFVEQRDSLYAKKRSVKTDFYKDSIEFDNIYSKHGHGYWQSECEMFARAFDCYIADKIKEQGYRSDFLSSHADSFIARDGDRVIAAFPRGEERAEINKAFDELFHDLKAREILHDAPVVEPVLEPEQTKPSFESKEAHWAELEQPVHYEQLSLDEMLFAASSKVSHSTSGNHGNLADRSR